LSQEKDKPLTIVCSLPRTGTLSLTKMAKIVGLNALHVGGKHAFAYLQSKRYEFYSDTPFYSLIFLEMIKGFDFNLIYIDKDPLAIYNSFLKVGLSRNFKLLEDWFNKNTSKPAQTFDYFNLLEVFKKTDLNQESFCQEVLIHKEKIINFAKTDNKPLLIYKFSDGWDPFCKFLNVDIPSEPLPHLNQSTMFDKI